MLGGGSNLPPHLVEVQAWCLKQGNPQVGPCGAFSREIG